MRVKRKAAKKQAEVDGLLLKKSSLNIDLLPEDDADRKTASLMRLAPVMTPEERQCKERGSILESQSIFETKAGPSPSSKKEQTVLGFKKMVATKKRQSSEGFGSSGLNFKVKRKEPPSSTAVNSSESNQPEKEPEPALSSLCDYSSSDSN